MRSTPFLLKSIIHADWRRLAGGALFCALYGGWLAFGDSPLTRALAAAGRLPELTPGFHPGEPAATLAKLGAARGDYLWLQAFDLPLAAIVVLLALLAGGLAAIRSRSSFAAARPFLLAPLAFLATELGENILLALFAAGLTSPSSPLGVVQQILTNLKLALGAATLIVSASFIATAGGGVKK